MHDPNEPDLADGDEQIAALLAFTPVQRRCRRHDGWTAEHQRRFIVALARTGRVDTAAHSVGRSDGGAWTVRKSLGAESFAAAWDAAQDLFHRRVQDELPEPPPPPRSPPPPPAAPLRLAPPRATPRHAGARRKGPAARPEDPELEEAEKEELIGEIMKRYGAKLRAERKSRLEGRIAEADFYVRQLSFIELVLDIGGRTQDLLEGLARDEIVPLPEAAATPGSALLEKARRAIWLEKGEADRPPPAPLGRHDARYATGEEQYDPARDGDRAAWEHKQAAKRRLAAEAQAEWEQRARDEAGNGPAAGECENEPAP